MRLPHVPRRASPRWPWRALVSAAARARQHLRRPAAARRLRGRRHRASPCRWATATRCTASSGRAPSSRRASSSRPRSAALVLVLPRDPVELTAPLAARPARRSCVGRSSPCASSARARRRPQDTLINLGGFQPVEIVKLAFVIFLAHYFGRRAAKLRHQRDRFLGLDFPRKRPPVPAVADPDRCSSAPSCWSTTWGRR